MNRTRLNEDCEIVDGTYDTPEDRFAEAPETPHHMPRIQLDELTLMVAIPVIFGAAIWIVIKFI